MKKEELFKLVADTSAELEEARYVLQNTPVPRISHSDIEDVSDAYQERLEYNWWVSDQRELIKSLEKDLALYRSQLDELVESL